MQKILQIEDTDNLIVALKDLKKGESFIIDNKEVVLTTDVKAKHKFTTEPIAVDGVVSLYGTAVGKATKIIAKGEVVTTENLRHYAAPVSLEN